MHKIVLFHSLFATIHSGDEEIWFMKFEHVSPLLENNVTGPYTHSV
jgi:hypothetical protein